MHSAQATAQLKSSPLSSVAWSQHFTLPPLAEFSAAHIDGRQQESDGHVDSTDSQTSSALTKEINSKELNHNIVVTRISFLNLSLLIFTIL
jgi:hypothetical protein